MHFITQDQAAALCQFTPYEFYSGGLEGWRVDFNDNGWLQVHLEHSDGSNGYRRFTYERFITPVGEIERWDEDQQCFFPATAGPRWGYFRTRRAGPLQQFAY